MINSLCCLSSSSVRSLCRVRLCGPVDCSRPGLPVHHQLPEPAQSHVHRVSDALQPAHPVDGAVETQFLSSSLNEAAWSLLHAYVVQESDRDLRKIDVQNIVSSTALSFLRPALQFPASVVPLKLVL